MTTGDRILAPRTFYVSVAVVKLRQLDFKLDSIERYEWVRLPFDVFIKWKWYFKYRAALLRIKYPRYFVKLTIAHHEVCTQDYIKHLENQILARRRKVSTIKNKLENKKQEWALSDPLGLTPFDQYAPRLDKVISKIEDVEKDRQQLEVKLLEIKSSKSFESNKIKVIETIEY